MKACENTHNQKKIKNRSELPWATLGKEKFKILWPNAQLKSKQEIGELNFVIIFDILTCV